MKFSKIFIITFFSCVILSMGYSLILAYTRSTSTPATLWQFQAIDTMKYSRDAAKDKSMVEKIPFYVQEVADLKATHIAIGTPYDEEFYPFLADWVQEARKDNLKVWFRGNFSGWEGWFNYPPLKNPADDHTMVKDFILRHPDLFQDGDIFTPVPEPENGIFGDPRTSPEKAQEFNQFLVDSYTNCEEAFAEIHKNVRCGYFSMNGDVAKDVLTKDTVKKIGNVVVIDHYVTHPETLGEDVEYLHKKFGAKIVLGEFGAPIPDLNGEMTEEEQASFVNALLEQLNQKKDLIEGVNYWVLAGGSTALLNDDNSPRLVTDVIKRYYAPNVWKGKITDTTGTTIFNANMHIENQTTPITAANDGTYSVTTPDDSVKITIMDDAYQPYAEIISFHDKKELNQTLVLEPLNPNLWYQIRVILHKLFFK